MHCAYNASSLHIVYGNWISVCDGRATRQLCLEGKMIDFSKFHFSPFKPPRFQ